jgi:TM2 domain-containing membrane protein YozV
MENQENQITRPESKRMTAALLALFLGSLGIHKFYLGYKNAGIAYLVIWAIVSVFSIISCGIGSFFYIPMWIFSVVEAVIYFTKTDEQFIDIYQLNKKEWL